MMLLKRFPITIRTRFEELGYKKVAFREENLCVHDVQRSDVSIPCIVSPARNSQAFRSNKSNVKEVIRQALIDSGQNKLFVFLQCFESLDRV